MSKICILLGLFLALFFPGAFGQNLLLNGDFESGFDEWENVIDETAIGEFTLETSGVYAGSGTMKLVIEQLGVNDWSVESKHSSWPSVAGKEYKLTLYAKAAEAGTAIRPVQQLEEYDAMDFILSTEWAQYEWIFIAKENNQQFKFHFHDGGTIFIDNIVIEENSVTYPDDNTLEVSTNVRFQIMEGFGGALAFYNSWVYAHPNKEEMYQLLYEDLGINLLRLRNYYRYETDFRTNDTEFVLKGEEYSDKDFKVLMCSWSPPANLKSNSNLNNGTLAKVNGEFVYQDFASYWRDAILAYRAIGIDPDWIGIQNEPDFLTDLWETCKFTPTETEEYPGYNVALETVSSTLSTIDNPPLIVGAEELGIGYNNFNNYSDPIKNSPNLWAYGYHLYHGGDPELPDSYNTSFKNIAKNYNDRPNIMTEYEHFDAGWFKTAWLVSNNISVGNASAYFYWNLIWPGSGLINIDNPWDVANWLNDKGYTVTPHFYAFKHFSKFIDVGYQRIECVNTNEGIKSSVFISPDDSKIVMVLLNVADHIVSTNVVPAEWEQEASMVYQSVEGNYFQSLESVSSTGIMDLPAQSITTIVYDADLIPIDPASISISPKELSLQVGNTSQLVATVLPEEATNKTVTWTSSNTDVVTVSGNGAVSAIGEGSAIVTVTTAIGGLSTSSAITVLPNGGVYFNVTVSINGSGSVSIDPLGLLYEAGTEITLMAVPNEGWRFDSWGGSTSGRTPIITSIVNSNLDIVVNFTEIPAGCDSYVLISLPYSLSGAGTFCWEARGNIESVNSWGCDLFTINGVDYCGQSSSSILAPDNGAYYIQYIASEAWAHVDINGTNSAGETFTLTVNPSIGGSVSPTSGNYVAGTTVSLTASPDEGYEFAGWGGDASGIATTTSISMDSDKSVTASFELKKVFDYTLTVNISGEGTVTPSTGSYQEGTLVTLMATPADDFEFVGWSGDAAGSEFEITLTMDSDKEVIANFIEENIPDCNFNTPIATPLPSINASFSNVHIIGTGPDLSNVINFTINWDLANNGLWQISMSTNNGQPGWWNDLSSKQSNNFASAQPGITLNGTGFPGLDGTYYVALDEGNFVMESQSGDYTIYFSNSASSPCLNLKYADFVRYTNSLVDISVYPNPFTNALIISTEGVDFINRIQILNTNGQVMYQQTDIKVESVIHINYEGASGIYILKIETDNNTLVKRISKK